MGVVSTHPHLDHINGLAETLNACQAAAFVYPTLYDHMTIARVVDSAHHTEAAREDYEVCRGVVDKDLLPRSCEAPSTPPTDDIDRWARAHP